jgi:hypothetical protein
LSLGARVDHRQGERDADHGSDEADGGDNPDQIVHQAVAQVHAVGHECQAAVEDTDGLIDRAAGLKLQDAQIDQAGREALLAVVPVGHPRADGRSIAGLRHHLVGLRQQALVEHCVLVDRAAPAAEDLAQSDEQDSDA